MGASETLLLLLQVSAQEGLMTEDEQDGRRPLCHTLSLITVFGTGGPISLLTLFLIHPLRRKCGVGESQTGVGGSGECPTRSDLSTCIIVIIY